MFLIDAQANSDNPQRLGRAAIRIVPALVVVAPERWEPRKRPRIPKAPTLSSFFTVHDRKVIARFLRECFEHKNTLVATQTGHSL